jgi:uncharacterized protein YqgV (UPF0045/DUF77 family)
MTNCHLGDSFLRNTEGPWDEVAQLIGFAHTLVHQEGIARVQTDIRIQTRYGLAFTPIFRLLRYSR